MKYSQVYIIGANIFHIKSFIASPSMGQFSINDNALSSQLSVLQEVLITQWKLVLFSKLQCLRSPKHIGHTDLFLFKNSKEDRKREGQIQ